MNRYTVRLRVVGYVTIEVEADTEAEAARIAEGNTDDLDDLDLISVEVEDLEELLSEDAT
jgi:hypothetical protein